MASSGPGFAQLASLYRSILRVHRQKLPAAMRMLGDAYAAQEVRRHARPTTTPQQWDEFGRQWAAYVAALRQDQPELVPEVVDLTRLSAAQQGQLERLREAAEALARGTGGSSGGGDPAGGSSGGNASSGSGRTN
jgi:hypothetical protein